MKDFKICGLAWIVWSKLDILYLDKSSDRIIGGWGGHEVDPRSSCDQLLSVYSASQHHSLAFCLQLHTENS